MTNKKRTGQHRRSGEQTHLETGSSYSPWISTTRPLRFSPLHYSLAVDVVIIGAGISGLSTAYELVKEGKKVAVVEERFIGSGETGKTTAHLTYALDDRYFRLQRLHGERGARIAAESHNLAINRIEEISQEENIDCSFERVNGYLYLGEGDSKEVLDKERKILHNLGFPQVKFARQSPLKHFHKPVLVFPRQAQIHPTKYLQGLAHAIVKHGGLIFTQTHVKKINGTGIITSDNYAIDAEHIVVATNTPINDRVSMHTKQASYRTYIIGALIKKGSVPKALYWNTNENNRSLSNAYHYVRLQPYTKQYDLLLIGGEDHKTGQEQPHAYVHLENWARKKFPIKKIIHRWSGQIIEPVDGLAFIGRNPSGPENIFIITGDSGNGMTHGTLAGILIKDLILERKNEWEDIYSPSRKPVLALAHYFKENLNVLKYYTELLKTQLLPKQELHRGQGQIIAQGLHKIAQYKDTNGDLYEFSALCPHLKCVVHWNDIERTFDCPCHGSRFTAFGKVVNGPATTDLEPRLYQELTGRKRL